MEFEHVRDVLEAVAQSVPCGNVWFSLNGDNKKRLCLECDRHVHNLAGMSADEFCQLREQNPERMCAVYEPSIKPPLKLWWRFAAALLPLLLMVQLAQAEEKKQLEKELRQCKDYLYVPMMVPPKTQCLNEKGKVVETGKWTSAEYKRLQRETEKQRQKETRKKP